MAYAGLAKYFDTPARGAWRDKLNARRLLGRRARAGQFNVSYYLRCRRIDRNRRGRRTPRDGARSCRSLTGGPAISACDVRAIAEGDTHETRPVGADRDHVK